MNDFHIVDCSETMGKMLCGDYTPRFDYCINGVKRSFPYWLAGGICPLWANFVKTVLRCSLTGKDNLHVKLQEVVRKDVESAFGVFLVHLHI